MLRWDEKGCGERGMSTVGELVVLKLLNPKSLEPPVLRHPSGGPYLCC